MQPVAADVDKIAGRTKMLTRTSKPGTLIEHPQGK
jgi:hypothetical protein